ncbi:Ubiquitin-associated and SH3 domain-containing protein A [Saguinus oedipus]|uniref:Ubiquitin-associated and SH3 domain-containing protein A n=1 Tax=Saguinus oedipus TaxID=9490 RepID=A0ABQ9TYM4_SAGOE|nr:Ubiquitin-associated and SH3 domain-containing protein A [Saguinus oedipus]
MAEKVSGRSVQLLEPTSSQEVWGPSGGCEGKAECTEDVVCPDILRKYYRPDLNFPCSLPRRGRGIKDFENDPPLSSCGIFQSRIAGDALLDSGIRISSVFASPALRCVQTAKLILEGQ